MSRDNALADSVTRSAFALGEFAHPGLDLAENVAELVAKVRLLGLIERHGWEIWPSDGNEWVAESTRCMHRAPTLTEALTGASECNVCTGRTE